MPNPHNTGAKQIVQKYMNEIEQIRTNYQKLARHKIVKFFQLVFEIVKTPYMA